MPAAPTKKMLARRLVDENDDDEFALSIGLLDAPRRRKVAGVRMYLNKA